MRNLACYLALGVTCDGDREVLGIWWQETEGSKFWLAVLNDLRRRGVRDVLISCVDGLKGFPEAIEATFPNAWVQTCIVHLIRASLRYVNYRDRKKVASALRPRPGRTVTQKLRFTSARAVSAAPSTRNGYSASVPSWTKFV